MKTKSLAPAHVRARDPDASCRREHTTQEAA
jgi:hypothetical protein